MKIKTSELKDRALGWAVATCEGYTNLRMLSYECNNPNCWDCQPELMMTDPDGDTVHFAYFATWPANWDLGGHIIEREKIELKYLGFDNPPCWGALKFSPSKYERQAAIGSTPLIAALRCYVASKLGDEVDVPEELV